MYDKGPLVMPDLMPAALRGTLHVLSIGCLVNKETQCGIFEYGIFKV